MSSATAKKLIVHECCGVGPFDGGDGNLVSRSFPITFFDVIWLYFHPIERLLFYEFPCSSIHFLETIVPTLKKSLSQTLVHYLTMSGNLIFPPDSGIPEFRYVPGDTLSLTIAEADGAFDFNYLTGYGAREADEFYALVPSLPETKIELESGLKMVPLLALQITLFPGVGFCIGFTNHHAVGDASSAVGFIKAWSAVSKLGGNGSDEFLAKNGLIPYLDRSVIKDPLGLKEIFWNEVKFFRGNSMPSERATGKVRQTYVLSKNDILKLKNLVLAKLQTHTTHLSSFTVTTAYIWTCFVKSASANGEDVEDMEPEFLGIPVDTRSRMDEAVPAAYFGNCVSFATVESTHGQLKGDEGFPMAAKSIGDFISNKVNKKGEILRDADKWFSKFRPLMGKRITAMSGSPKFDLYEADFGWGTANKYEAVTIDRGRTISLCKSRQFEGGLEAAMTLPKNQMEAFATIFANGLHI